MDLTPEQQDNYDHFFGRALGKMLVEADMEDGVLKLTFVGQDLLDVAVYTMKLAKTKQKPIPIEPVKT